MSIELTILGGKIAPPRKNFINSGPFKNSVISFYYCLLPMLMNSLYCLTIFYNHLNVNKQTLHNSITLSLWAIGLYA